MAALRALPPAPDEAGDCEKEEGPEGAPPPERGPTSTTTTTERESPQDDAKAIGARGRASRSERRALVRHGVGDAADPRNGGVYAETAVAIEVARSPIHSWGGFTDEPIVQGTQVLSIAARRLVAMGERRQEMHERTANDVRIPRRRSAYSGRDARARSRFVNHSARRTVSDRATGRKKIAVYTKRDAARPGVCDAFELEDENIPPRRGDVAGR